LFFKKASNIVIVVDPVPFTIIVEVSILGGLGSANSWPYDLGKFRSIFCFPNSPICNWSKYGWWFFRFRNHDKMFVSIMPPRRASAFPIPPVEEIES